MHQLIDKKNRIIIYLIFLIMLSTTNNKTLKIDKNYTAKINKINVTGLSSIYNKKIKKRLDNFSDRNIFMLEKEEISKIISEYNIIEEYEIKKVYPSRLNVEIKPTKFIAKIPGNNLLVGSNGKLIKTKTKNEKLPYIFGEFNSKEFLKFKKSIMQSKFNFSNLRSIFFFPLNRWDVLTTDGILIKLPERDLSKSLHLAHKIMMNNQFKDNMIIDLRIANRLITK